LQTASPPQFHPWVGSIGHCPSKGTGVSLQKLCCNPLHRLRAKMAKMMNMNNSSENTFSKAGTAESIVFISFFMEGMALRERRGLNNLKVLRELTPLNEPLSDKREVMTTVKSSQFQVSLK